MRLVVLLVCVLAIASTANAAHRLKSKLAVSTLEPVRVSDPAGNSCEYLGETQQCSVWCSANCGGPCSSCEAQSGLPCACDDVPAISNKKAAKIADPTGNSCQYLGETEQCSVWCGANCGGPCSSCLESSGSECACDDVPAINSKAKIQTRTYLAQYAELGYSCRYLGETENCADWCSATCSGPCSSCLEGSGSDCACDEVPAISSKKAVKTQDPTGNSCQYLGETEQCSVWCGANCGGPCSSCLEASGSECACDDVPAINSKARTAGSPGGPSHGKVAAAGSPGGPSHARSYLHHYAALGYSCRYLGETENCADWCTSTCGGPCSVCLESSGNECACDDVPAISSKKAVKTQDPTGNSCQYLGETEQCSVWCGANCGGPCSSCLEASGSECACDDIPAISNIRASPTPGAITTRTYLAQYAELGYSCQYLGETENCADWCAATCGGPCSACESGSGSLCACDDIPAINN